MKRESQTVKTESAATDSLGTPLRELQVSLISIFMIAVVLP